MQMKKTQANKTQTEKTQANKTMSASGREYVPLDVKVMKKSTRITALIAGVGLLVMGVVIRSVYTSLVGALLLAAMALNKKTAVTERGIEITYDIGVFKRVDLWRFEEIQEIHKELSPDKKKYALHIMRDVMSRRLVFYIPDAEEVIGLALEKNPAIHVADVD